MVKKTDEFYAARGTDETHGYTRGVNTQYGKTIDYCGLRLHMGDYLYGKRGGAQTAFLFDKIDYRYRGLLRALGLDELEPCGALLGCFYEVVDGVINFRVTEENPSDVILCFKGNRKEGPLVITEPFSEGIYDQVFACGPTAVTVSPNREWFQAVFPLSRKFNVDDPNIVYDDNYFDMEPDVADVCGLHGEGVDDNVLVHTRLHYCGFTSSN